MVKWLAFLSVFFLISCVKDKPNPWRGELPVPHRHGALVLNEGIYGNNNASLSFIDFTDQNVYQQLNQTVNGKSLGDVAQDMIIVNNQLWISLNNSNKLVVLNSQTYQFITEIKPIEFPRDIVLLNDSLLAVSSLYTTSVYILNYHTYQVVKTLNVDYPNTEHMLVHKGYLYITNWNEASSWLYKINIHQLNQIEKINLAGKAGHDIVADQQDNIWVLSGNQYKGVQAHLQRFNTGTGEGQLFTFNASAEPLKMTIDPTGNILYFLNINYNGQAENNGLYRMNITDTALPKTALVQAHAGSYFYALGIDPKTNHILLSDPKGFNQQSTVYEYSANGNLLNEYQTGLGTNQFLFP